MNTLKISNIIFADDDDDDIAIFKDIIQQLAPSIKIFAVRDGQELLETLSSFCPDLLFLDLDMPRQNGLQCLQAIRSSPTICELPVVVFSSTTRPANIQTAYELGAHLFLIKSHSVAEYCASLKAILELDWSTPTAIKEQYRINDRYTAFS